MKRPEGIIIKPRPEIELHFSAKIGDVCRLKEDPSNKHEKFLIVDYDRDSDDSDEVVLLRIKYLGSILSSTKFDPDSQQYKIDQLLDQYAELSWDEGKPIKYAGVYFVVVSRKNLFDDYEKLLPDDFTQWENQIYAEKKLADIAIHRG